CYSLKIREIQNKRELPDFSPELLNIKGLSPVQTFSRKKCFLKKALFAGKCCLQKAFFFIFVLRHAFQEE
ncbi:hypothetical protein, partial [Butyricimonas faecihominis]|uniref:hypothetical protein n=1 Tax=Butyricimonas faecihominis TaxID=1472416 RepID=UPI0019D04752